MFIYAYIEEECIYLYIQVCLYVGVFLFFCAFGIVLMNANFYQIVQAKFLLNKR